MPNSGKTSLAKELCRIEPDSNVICCADDYFMDTFGNYNWDANKLNQAHQYSQTKAKAACESNIKVVVIANTNVTQRDITVYEELAKEYNYTVRRLVIERNHDGDNGHGVPEESVNKMKTRLASSLKL